MEVVEEVQLISAEPVRQQAQEKEQEYFPQVTTEDDIINEKYFQDFSSMKDGEDTTRERNKEEIIDKEDLPDNVDITPTKKGNTVSIKTD